MSKLDVDYRLILDENDIEDLNFCLKSRLENMKQFVEADKQKFTKEQLEKTCSEMVIFKFIIDRFYSFNFLGFRC